MTEVSSRVQAGCSVLFVAALFAVPVGALFALPGWWKLWGVAVLAAVVPTLWLVWLASMDGAEKERRDSAERPVRKDPSCEDTEFMAGLRARFAEQGVNVLVDWDSDRLTEDQLMMRYGFCWECRRALACRSTWTLGEDGVISGRVDMLCGYEHNPP